MEKETRNVKNFKGSLELFVYSLANLIRLYFFITLVKTNIGVAFIYIIFVNMAFRFLSKIFKESIEVEKDIAENIVNGNNINLKKEIKKLYLEAVKLRKENAKNLNNLDYTILIISYILTPFAFRALANIIILI